MDCCDVKYKAKERDEESIKDLQIRLNRIIGQLNGVKGMIDDNRYCADILIQISAIQSALKEVSYKKNDAVLSHKWWNPLSPGDSYTIPST